MKRKTENDRIAARHVAGVAAAAPSRFFTIGHERP
jgi:hypothetical protein